MSSSPTTPGVPLPGQGAPSGPMEWSFSFQGPKAPRKVRGCSECGAAASGLCLATPPHAHVADGCGSCAASVRGFCSGHGLGVYKAMDAFSSGLSGDAQKHFQSVRPAIEAELLYVPDQASVNVRAFCSVGQHVDAKGERTGNPPRNFSLEVKQLPE